MLTLLSHQIKAPLGIFKALKSYQGSAAQRHLHAFIRDEQIFKLTKQGIDYTTINKNTKGRFFFRQFLFQEKVQQNYIAPADCALLPMGKWTRAEIKDLTDDMMKTQTENDNADIVVTCQAALETVFKDYYTKLGKPGYKFILTEQIGKINQMSEQEFNQFVEVLGASAPQLLAKYS